jgi:hypothetical protein
MPVTIDWGELVLPPINLWNVPLLESAPDNEAGDATSSALPQPQGELLDD